MKPCSLNRGTGQRREYRKHISALLGAIDCAINDAVFYITGRGKLSGEKWKIEISEAVQSLEEKDIFMEYYFACELGVSLEAFQAGYVWRKTGQ